jgi:hypothetical protein
MTEEKKAVRARRRVTLVTEEEVEKGRRPRLRAFGRATIAKLSGATPQQVKNAIRRKAFNPDSMESTMKWIMEQKQKFGLPPAP